jgi:hypothetical protein
MGSPTCYACCGKEMLSWIYEKMVIQESAPGGGRFFTSGSIVIGNSALACNSPCVAGWGACNGPMTYRLRSLQWPVPSRRGLFNCH